MLRWIAVALALTTVALDGQTDKAALPTQAQTGALNGKVQDEAGGTLPIVTVSVNGVKGLALTRSTTTSDDGTFTFADLPAGKYEVTFTLEGFRRVKRKNVVVQSNGRATGNARMRIDSRF